MLTHALSMLTFTLLLTATLVAQQQTAQDAIALISARVINVRDGSVRSNATVVLRGGRIESIGTGAAPAGTKVLDLRGRYLLPGLVDAHVHIANLRAMRTALESGVTTARSAGVSSYVDVGIRELVKHGAVVGPDMLASGYHVRPMVAEEAFFDHPSLSPLMRGGMTTPDALRQMVQANLSRNVDWIKVLATERAGTADTDPRKQVYTEAELRTVVEEAATKNVPVLAHAHGAEGALAAVKAGVRSIEHGTYLPDEALQLMAKQGTYFVPTVNIVHDVAEVGGDYDNRDLQLRGHHMLPRITETIFRAQRLGVKIVTGADSGYGPASVARVSKEYADLVDAGVPPLTALQAATLTAAEMLRLEKQIGLVEVGYQADLLVVERNPLEHTMALQDPLLVISNGRVGLDRLNFGK